MTEKNEKSVVPNGTVKSEMKGVLGEETYKLLRRIPIETMEIDENNRVILRLLRHIDKQDAHTLLEAIKTSLKEDRQKELRTIKEWEEISRVTQQQKGTLKSEQLVVQINEDEPDTIEIIFADERSHFAAYFTLKKWENFKKGINNYDVKSSKVLDIKGTEISVSIDRQEADELTLHLDDNKIMTMIGFPVAEWENFKKQINDFEVFKKE